MDELRINMHQESIYSWSKRVVGPKDAVYPTSFSMSFVIAFLIDRKEDVLVSNHSINSKILFYIFWLIYENLSKVMIIRTRRLALFLIIEHAQENWMIWLDGEHWWKWISIPPYSPQLNTVEKIIAVIKHKVKKKLLDSKILSLKSTKKIIDQISPETWRKWISSSWIETLSKIRILNNSL